MILSGVVSAMKTTLKNNKRERKSAFKNLKDKGVESSGKTELHFENKATPRQLKEIRKKLQRENKIRTRNRLLIIGVIIVILIYFIGFY